MMSEWQAARSVFLAMIVHASGLRDAQRYYDYNINVNPRTEGVTFSMTEMSNGRFWLGRGQTLEEAIGRSVPVMTIPDKEQSPW